MLSLKGAGVALITPFTPEYEVDTHSLGKLVSTVIEGGISFLVVLGSTGEAATLTDEEKQHVFNTVYREAAGRVPVIIGIAGNNTRYMLQEMRSNMYKDADGIMISTPYYNKPTQTGLYEHYCSLVGSTELPIIIYNIPGRTGCNMLPTTIIDLSLKYGNIVGVKEASGSIEQIEELLIHSKEDFSVLSGDDPLTLPFMSLGAHGVISVMGQVLPTTVSAIAEACLENDIAKARKLHFEMKKITELAFQEGNPTGVKCMLNLRGQVEDYLRLPLMPASQQLRSLIEEELQHLAKRGIN